jgi:hypothetical protein
MVMRMAVVMTMMVRAQVRLALRQARVFAEHQ